MDEFLTFARLKEILRSARALKVGVVGDFSLQGAWLTDIKQAHPRPIVEERYSCGGAASVARSLAALGLSEVRAFTILGDDWRGELLLRALHEAGVDAQDALTAPGWSTPFTGQVLQGEGAEPREDMRFDFVNSAALALESEEMLLARVEDSLPDMDALVIADYYLNGVISPAVLDGLNNLAASFDRAVFVVDSCTRIGQFQGMMRKSNEVEAGRWLFPEQAPGTIQLAEFAEAALYPQVDCGCPLFINLRERGCLVLSDGESHLVPVDPGIAETQTGDDAFLAALTAGLAARANPVEAARLGNLAVAAAGMDGTLDPQNILALAQNLEEGKDGA